MNNLYTDLSEVYEAMYKTFIDYSAELNFYSELLAKYNCNSVIEIGCGTGNLAQGFTDKGFDYFGLDLSDEMLKMARTKHPSLRFTMADVRNFDLHKKSSSAIITGRTISYLVTNDDVINAFTAINNNLVSNGLLCFDFIDANKFIPSVKDGLSITHSAAFNNRQYHRESYWKANLAQNLLFDWRSEYYEEMYDGSRQKIGGDNSCIRAFCKDEIMLFLQLTGFAVQDMMYRSSYAFDTFVAVAQKI